MGYIAKPPLGTPLNRSHPLAQRMVRCYLLNEASGFTVNDSAGLTKETNSLRLWGTGKYGPHAYMDPSTTLRALSTGYIPGNELTVHVFVQLLVVGNSHRIWTAGLAPTYIDLEMAGGKYDFYGSGFDLFPATAPAVANNWDVITCTWQSGVKAELFYNGKLVASDSAINTVTLQQLGFGYSANFNLVYAVAYNRVLTPSEIMSLYIDPYQMFRPSMPYWFWSSLGGVTYTLDCNAGSVTVAGGSAGVFFDRLLTGSAGDVDVAGGNAALLKDSLLTGNAGAATVAGGQAQVLKDSLLNGSAGQVTIIGGQAKALKDSLLTGSAGAATIAGGSGDLLKDSLLNGNAGEVTVAGGNAAILRAFVLAALAGVVTVEGGSAGLIKDSILTGSGGAVTVAGGDAEITLIVGGATYTLNCLSGEVTAAGGQAQFLKDSILAGTGAAVTLAGLTADMLLTRALTGNAGAVEITGNDATLVYHRLLAGSAARVTLAGGQAVLIYSLEAFVPAAARTIIMATEDRVVIIPLESRSIEVED